MGGWLYTEIGFVHRELNPGPVSYPNTNRARRRVALLIEANALPVHYSTALRCTDDVDDADELVIENLNPETDYVFYVRAKNDVGVGERTETRATTTRIS